MQYMIYGMPQGIMKMTFEVLQNNNSTLNSLVVISLKSHRSCDFGCQCMVIKYRCDKVWCLIVGQDVIGQKLVLVAKFNCNKRYSKKKSAKFNHSIPTIWRGWLLFGIEFAPMLLLRMECVYG